MATTATVQRVGRDRRLCLGSAVAIPIIVFIGFARSYYLKGFFDTPALPGLLVHLHGIPVGNAIVGHFPAVAPDAGRHGYLDEICSLADRAVTASRYRCGPRWPKKRPVA